MQTKYLCVLIHICTKGAVGLPLNRFKLSKNIFTDRSKAVFLSWIIYFIFVLFCYVFMHVCLIMPFGHLLVKGLTSWLSSVMFHCDVVTFPLISWVSCCA